MKSFPSPFVALLGRAGTVATLGASLSRLFRGGLRRTSLLILLPVLAPITARAELKAEIVEVKKIWDAGNHNAFTDLIRWHDRWWCTFRESDAHVGGDGAIRVLTSADGS